MTLRARLAFALVAYVTLYGFLGARPETPTRRPSRGRFSFNGQRRYHPPKHGRLGYRAPIRWPKRSLRHNRRGVNGSLFTPGSAEGEAEAAPAGLQYLAGGATAATPLALTAAMVTATQAAKYNGWYLDPRGYFNAAGLIIEGVQNFWIESRMGGSIGYNGTVYGPANGYVATGSGTDGVQVYGNSGSETSGIFFYGVAFVGTNTNAVLHFGGRQRDCELDHCFVQNTSSSSASYAFIIDTQLENYNSENCDFSFSCFAGGYAAIGIGIANGTQNTNDCIWTAIRTNGGTYGINAVKGGKHAFLNYYDRSNPVTATVNNSGATGLIFYGGEDQNNTGYAHQIAGASAVTTIVDRNMTESGASNTAVLNYTAAGTFNAEGYCSFAFSSSGTACPVTMGSVAGTFVATSVTAQVKNITFTGSSTSALLQLAPSWLNSGAPTVSGFSGLVMYGNVVLSSANTGQTGTTTLSFIPQPVSGTYRVNLYIKATAVTTSIVPTLSYKDEGGSASTPTCVMVRQSTAASVISIVAAAKYTCVMVVQTDNSQGTFSVVITPTSATYDYECTIEWIDSP
jgi:hypothetical protein